MLPKHQKSFIARLVLILALLSGTFGMVTPKQVLAAAGDTTLI